MSSTVFQVRIDENLRQQASEIFHNLGLDMSSAVRLFLNRVVVEQGLPFSMNLKNEQPEFDAITFLNNYNGESQ